MPPAGFEPGDAPNDVNAEHASDSGQKRQANAGAVGAPSGARTAHDPDLARLIDAWPSLTPDQRSRILAILEAAG